MSIEVENKASDNLYRLMSIEKTKPTEGMSEGDCYRYIIGQGRSQIVCIRSGTLQSVTQYAEAFAENLNSRASKGFSTYSARKQKK